MYNLGFDDAYISWINDGKLAWTMLAAGLAADQRTEIGPRPIAMEPMVRFHFPSCDCIVLTLLHTVPHHEARNVLEFRRG